MVTQLFTAMYDIKAKNKVLQASVSKMMQELKNKSIPLDERWEVYKDLVESKILVNVESFGNGYVDFLEGAAEFLLYEDFNIERHETTSFINLYDQVIEMEDEKKPTEESIIEWQEQVLASGYSAFCFDW